MSEAAERRMIVGLCESCKNNPCGYASEDVIRCGDFEENFVQTNADRIRAMSDDELLGFLMQFQHEAEKRFAAFKTPNYNELAEWLKQPCPGWIPVLQGE